MNKQKTVHYISDRYGETKLTLCGKWTYGNVVSKKDNDIVCTCKKCKNTKTFKLENNNG